MHQLDFIESLFQDKIKNRVFVKLDSKYADYYSEHSNYFGRALRLLNHMYDMTNSGKLFADELTKCLPESGFIQYKCHMSIYYNYAQDGKKIVVLSYVHECIY